jgi:uncharacterized protein
MLRQQLQLRVIIVIEQLRGRGRLGRRGRGEPLMVSVLLFVAALVLPQKPDHYVTDRAGVVKNADALNEKLANFERQTSDQILVYVDQHLPAETTIEEMGAEAMRQWKVGQQGKDNGAILFVFTGDRKMRIEVGYGLEGSLTDAKAKWITSTVIKPEFQHGDFNAGINSGVEAILATIRGEAYRGSGRTVSEAGPRGIDIPLWVWPPAIVFFIGLYFLIFRQRKGFSGRTWTSGSSSSSWSSDSSSSSSSDSSSSSSSSSSSFEGGGGSGGGGGASDSW